MPQRVHCLSSRDPVRQGTLCRQALGPNRIG